jgi:pimeloyl-ACP methyl ester carboxylesterase
MSSLRLGRLPGEEALPSPEGSFPSGLAAVTVPTMVIAGRNDELLLPDWPEQLRAINPAVRVARIEGRHCPNIDCASAVHAVLIEFWRSIRHTDVVA